MLIDCPGCRKSYHIIKSALGPEGRRVACPRCDAIWFVPAQTSDTTILAEAEKPAPIPAHSFPLIQITASNEVGREFSPVAHARRKPRMRAGLPVSFAVLAIGMALIGWRMEIARLWPRTATLYAAIGLPVNLRGLALANFHTITLNEGHQRVLHVEGQIINLRAQATPLPPIRLAVRDAQGQSLYSWTVIPQKPRLAAGEKLLFQARLAAPPQAGRQLSVDFAGTPAQGLASLWHAASRF